jgi:hypothetical protein
MMRPARHRIGRMVAAAILTLALASCSDYDNVSVHGSVGMYYGTGYYDPWYYGPRYGPPVVVVPPPSSRPPRPEHPIARPPPARPQPLPARPAPRPMPRGR